MKLFITHSTNAIEINNKTIKTIKTITIIIVFSPFSFLALLLKRFLRADAGLRAFKATLESLADESYTHASIIL